jgi:hypothetical protein
MAMDMNRRRQKETSGSRLGDCPAAPAGERLPLNVVEVRGLKFLRVVVPAGSKVHLVSYLAPESPRHRVSAKRLGPGRRSWDLGDYEPVALMLRRWAGRTLCGRSWSDMAAHAVEIELVATDRTYVCPSCAAVVGEVLLPVGIR